MAHNDDLASPSAVPINKVYTHKLDNGKYTNHPHCLYLYYIKKEHPDKKTWEKEYIRHYFYAKTNRIAIEHDDVVDIVTKMVKNARKREYEQMPPPDGANFKYLSWRRMSYFAIVIDDDVIAFEHDNGVTFDEDDGNNLNHSFFDAEDLQFTVGESKVSLFFCINHMKADSAGNGLGLAMRKFDFDLNTVPALRTDSVTRLRKRFPDDGGTNTGPSVPPPP